MEMAAAIDLTRRLRAWRDLVQVPAAGVLAGRGEGDPPREFVGRLARFSFDSGEGVPVASVGGVQVLASADLDPDAVRSRVEGRREELRGEIRRAEGRLANEGFVGKAPPEVVEEEREKLTRYRAELEELE